MNVDFLMKTNPFNIPGMPPMKPSNSETNTTQNTQNTATQSRPSGANFVQKIKDTNDAVGFIQTAEAFLGKLDKEGVTTFDGALELAKNTTFAQKTLSSKQAFDTNAGIINVDITSTELGFGGDFEEWKANVKTALKDKKTQISNPLAAFGAQKKEQMENAAQKLSESQSTAKLGSLLGEINDTLNSFEKQANDLGNALF
jgi:hypothetical protein